MSPNNFQRNNLNLDITCRFSLSSPGSLERALAFLTDNYSNVAKDKLCVVSVVGKSCIQSNGCKASLIDKALGKNIFRGKFGDKIRIDTENLCQIEGFFDSRNKVIFLHLVSYFDTDALIKITKEFNKDIRTKGFFQFHTDLSFSALKAILLLFIISHIVVIVNPSTYFDTNYLHLFRLLDLARNKTQSLVKEILLEFEDVSCNWVYSGRPCSPRVLFVFEAYHKSYILKNKRQYEQHLEDQIYRFLRKSRIITNVCGNSLFAVCNQLDFVYISTEDPTIRDSSSFFLDLLKQHCSEATITKERDKEAKDFYSFLWSHINVALSKGFDDNVVKYDLPPVFELPTVATFFGVAIKLRDLFTQVAKTKDAITAFNYLERITNIDIQFSKSRCAKVMPLALSFYQEGLPSYYSAEYHNQRLVLALQILTNNARGQAIRENAAKLKEKCDAYWRNGRQRCKKQSIFGLTCQNPLHLTFDNDFESDEELEGRDRNSLPVMRHRTTLKIVSACNCGRKQLRRPDPFTVAEANQDFYEMLSETCCGFLKRIDFLQPQQSQQTDKYENKRLNEKTQSLISLKSSDQFLVKSKDTCSSKIDTGRTLQVLKMSYNPLKENQIWSSSNPESDWPECGWGESENKNNIESDKNTYKKSNKENKNDDCIDNDGNDSNGVNDDNNCADYQLDSFYTENEYKHRNNVENNHFRSSKNEADQTDEYTESSDVTSDVDHDESKDSERNLYLENKDFIKNQRSSRRSTAQYLKSLIAGGSPHSLLPKFSSWSLVCLGQPGSHSQNMALQGQPGFLAGSNFLIPWYAKFESSHNLEQVPQLGSGVTLVETFEDFKKYTVRILIGIEYECLMGHRFMYSKLGKIPKEDKLINQNEGNIFMQDLPLYVKCESSRCKFKLASLMRIHILIPKAPIKLNLYPLVKIGTIDTVFTPECNEPIEASHSSYWVLRFPFVYDYDGKVFAVGGDHCVNSYLLKEPFWVSEYIPK